MLISNSMIINNLNSKPESFHVVRHGSVIINTVHSRAFLFKEFNMSKFKRKDKILGICKYCGSKATHRFKNGVLCCEDNVAKCSIMRKISSEINKGKNHWNYGNDKWAKEKAKGAPLCACGCGKKTRWCVDRKRFNQYIFGHYGKGKKRPRNSS